ncbi:glycosyltransferase family 4 protein [Pseudoalteromonas sp. CST5]|uniref:glycosyltransferase family 4 protein n=1 Tax=unclassified Pseudoalteromonas TaxID=194690 RepID=UPI002359CE9D|nr:MULTISPECIES: glycosyltransferase family 4 protein [unclassified Pseudoalteromonas]MDC9513058.1 glycosyltransferase family 4 protein [Pseudoalteromonas sp. CST1]MDC9537205.1 glycosyltransferase family 4 protein [Pseudoalteromonas sp. CST3]MDC9541519.1 glycosyltransferase family 4 protein [Pseudoalteromonas sp. CST2]MDC9545798.1 glycosyltransferase family 4 protein [Pseudoalteromonas sp. CST4]MDC9548550.1 glycosyltransferase family 4 protein [Pseudoalteromonas sp. CST5]
MKVLFLCSNLNNTGGTERVGSIIANQLSESGYDVFFASLMGGENPFFPLSDNIKTLSLFKSTGRSFLRAPLIIYRLRKILKDNDIDVVIAIESMLTLFTLPSVLGLPVKHVCWEHFNFKSDLGRASRRVARQLAARYSDSIVTLTERDKRYWLANTKHKSQVTAIANPCPFVVQESEYKSESKTVLSVGRLAPQKGFDLLLSAWVEVIKLAPDWKLQIVGDGDDKKQLATFISANNISTSVELVGKTNNIQKYYDDAGIYCLSSRFEGFPMVLLETLSFGLPVVSFDCDTGPEEVLENTGGILVKPYDTHSLALALLELMNDKQKRESISIMSKEKAQKYQPDTIIEHWKKLLEEL